MKLIKRLRIPRNNYEIELQKQGIKVVAGLDEVGRGALAGPVVSCACILPKRMYRLRDSKLLLRKEREKLSFKIRKQARIAIGSASPEEINILGLTKATYLAYRRAIKNLRKDVDFILVDGYTLKDFNIQNKGIIKGDMKSISIAAASICAKVYRDSIMRRLHKKYPQYNFRENKGYGTQDHRRRLAKYGVSQIHRRNFKPIMKLLNDQ